jgi:tetratricopeptide (TPR) repeat protein
MTIPSRRWGLACALVALFATFSACSTGKPKAAKSASPARPAARSHAAKHALATDEATRRIEAQAHYASGIVRELRNEPQLALDEYLASARNDPANEPLVIELAQRLLREQKADQAVALLEKTAALRGASSSVDAWLGMALSQAGRTEQAVAAFRRATRKAPNALFGYHGLAQLYLRQKQPQQALKVLDEAAAQTRANAAFLVDLAEFLGLAAHTKVLSLDEAKPRALGLLERAARLNPAQPAVLQKMADAYKRFGELGRAADLYLDLLKRHPTGSRSISPMLREQLVRLYLASGEKQKAAEQLKAMLSDNPLDPRASFLLGALAAEDKRYTEAAGYYEQTIQLHDDFEEAYYELAGAQLAQDEPAAALETLGRARGRFSPTFVLEFYTGLAHTALKQYAEALKNFTSAEVLAKAAEPARLNSNFYAQLGAVFAGLGDQSARTNRREEARRQFDEAETALRQAIAAAPDSPETFLQVGAIYERMANRAQEGQREEEQARFFSQAEKHLRRCVELAPENAEALNYLGYMWAERGVNLLEAQQLIDRALKREPENAAYLDSLAWVLFKLAQPEAALLPMRQAIAKSSKPDAVLLDHLGDIYQALGRPADALDAWRKSLDVEDRPEVRRKLEGPPASPPRQSP